MAIALSSRQVFFFVAISCAPILAITWYMEHGLGLAPCNLCLLQRAGFMAIGVIALASAVHNKATEIYALLMLICAVLGVVLSGRQLWLQSLAEDQVPGCGTDLPYLLDVLPLTEVITQVFNGSSQCAELVWLMAGLSIALWSFIAFSGIFVLAAAICRFGSFEQITTKETG